MSFVIKYGNRLYLYKLGEWTFTHNVRLACSLDLKEAEDCLTYIKADTGLYEARIVPESDIAVVVESVP